MLFRSGIPILGAFLYGGVYQLPQAYDFSCTGLYTNLTPTDAYRGAGRPEATYAIERAMDMLADQMGLEGWGWDFVRLLDEHLSSFGYVVIAVFVLSWLLSMAIFRLKGYDKIRVRG